MTRVLLVHPNRLFREGLAGALAGQAGLEVIGTASDAAAAAEQARALEPDIVVLDVGLATGGPANSIRMLAAACPRARIVALGVAESDAEILACLEAGAIGYILKDGSFSDLLQVIEAAAQNEAFASPRLIASLCRRLANLTRLAQPAVLANAPPLTRREREIVALIVAGLANKEIAVRLGIEPQTVKNHVHNILEKFQLGNRHEIARQVQVANLV